MRRMSKRKPTVPIPSPANDNGEGSRLRIKVLIPKAMPATRVEIEVLASLLDDLPELVANDNEETRK